MFPKVAPHCVRSHQYRVIVIWVNKWQNLDNWGPPFTCHMVIGSECVNTKLLSAFLIQYQSPHQHHQSWYPELRREMFALFPHYRVGNMLWCVSGIYGCLETMTRHYYLLPLSTGHLDQPHTSIDWSVPRLCTLRLILTGAFLTVTALRPADLPS